jgi:hypothetical protein
MDIDDQSTQKQNENDCGLFQALRCLQHSYPTISHSEITCAFLLWLPLNPSADYLSVQVVIIDHQVDSFSRFPH